MTNEDLPQISIIVPARNEEKNIEHCINSLLNSNYPKDKFEIVVVNDRSTDSTLDIITKLSQAHTNIVIKNVENKTKRNLQGKPGAIQAGIDIANGEIFLLTDADCTVHKNWILTFANQFRNSKLGMVCSYTNVKGNKPFYHFQATEWLYMHTYGCAGIGIDTPLGCFGNNTAISREAYYKVGGYENIKFSVTEDYALLKAVFDVGYEIYYICDENSLVETLPNITFKDYIIQHKRWAIGGLALGWKAFLFVFSSICMWAAIALAIIIGLISNNYIFIIIALFLRLLGDALILFPIFKILRINYLKKWLPLTVIFFSLIELIVPFVIIDKKVVWKGQVFSQHD